MLFDKLVFGNREAVAKQEILQGVMVQNVENMEHAFAVELEVVTKVVTAQTIEGFAGANETTERFPWVRKLFGFERTDRFHGRKLGQRIEFFEFT